MELYPLWLLSFSSFSLSHVPAGASIRVIYCLGTEESGDAPFLHLPRGAAELDNDVVIIVVVIAPLPFLLALDSL